MTWGTRNGFHVSFSKRLKAGNPKSQRGSREAKIENDAPGVRPRTGGSSRHGIYRWISVSSQKIIVFEIHVKSTNDGKQVSLKITWIYNDFYNDFTGIGSPQVFFFSRKECPSKSPKILDWISLARQVEKLHSNPPASTSPSVTKEVSLSERLGSPEKAHSGKIEDLIRMNGW